MPASAADCRRRDYCGAMMAGPARCILSMIVLGLSLAWGCPVRAQMGKPPSVRYLVINDVNLRAKPTTNSAKAGGLKKGQTVEVLAITKDGWLNVKQGEGGNSFVYIAYLVPLIDGSLKSVLKGKVSGVEGVSCAYAIHFTGKSGVADENFSTADYDVSWRCRYQGKDISFGAFMFITEAPYAMSRDRIYQISLDVREVGDGVEGALSTIVLYDSEKKSVILDSVSLAKFARPSPAKERPAASISAALTGAVELAMGAWNADVWAALAAEHGIEEKGGR
jgi:hypothetical protein